MQDIFQNESRVPAGNWGAATIPYTNVRGDEVEHRDTMKIPEGWKWTDDWTADLDRACDEEGLYSFIFIVCHYPHSISTG